MRKAQVLQRGPLARLEQPQTRLVLEGLRSLQAFALEPLAWPQVQKSESALEQVVSQPQEPREVEQRQQPDLVLELQPSPEALPRPVQLAA